MLDFDINYPSPEHKNYLESMYKYCQKNNVSILLKGSLSNKTATKYSDIDLILLGIDIDNKIDELITVHGKPVMTNFTTNPKGIIVLVHKDGICIDMDIRKTISYKELEESIVLLDINEDFVVSEDNIVRCEVNSRLLPDRSNWYRILRLVHRGTIKYLSSKTQSAMNLLSETKESLGELEIYNLEFKDNFEDDIQIIFYEICKRFKVSNGIKLLFNGLFREF
ncbi:hypothetical protein [Dethiothermospora halolimnae]|uniref:hypothetical protein n=1 Tax=Dethiothermospora halolimnae TaxID=3114390 RepID=UPI003CCBC628